MIKGLGMLKKFVVTMALMSGAAYGQAAQPTTRPAAKPFVTAAARVSADGVTLPEIGIKTLPPDLAQDPGRAKLSTVENCLGRQPEALGGKIFSSRTSERLLKTRMTRSETV